MRRLCVLISLIALSAVATAETVSLPGEQLAVFNLAGSLRIELSGETTASADVALLGPDAGQLTVDTVTTQVQGQRTTALVVRYPQGDIVYRRGGSNSRTEVRVAKDGTFDRSGDNGIFGKSRRVLIRSNGSGTRAHADIVLRLPPGKYLAAYQAVGEIIASDLTSDLYLDTHQGDIDATRINGDINADTGSGDVLLQSIQGERLNADTGSGDVELVDVNATRVNADTGSGNIVIRSVDAETVRADTGSGDVLVEYAGLGGRLVVDTGSGDVEIRVPADLGVDANVSTGSGGIRSRLEGMNVREQDRNDYDARRGGGELRLSVDTGSGSVTLTE